jgi:1-acyl-sn-glycerol-3-phosphate acyltransferase
MGALSSTVLALMVLFGMIRITPLLNMVNQIMSSFFSTLVPNLDANIRTSFPVKGSAPTDRSIFMWHPHGLFCTSHFFHIGTQLTDWPGRNIKGVVLNTLTWMPFMAELFEYFQAVPSNYASMKEALNTGSSISVAPGGMREMLYPESALISRRKGIFRLALETGTPLVPIVSVNEDSLYTLVTIPQFLQDWLEPYDLCIPIPTLKSVLTYLGILVAPLPTPILSVIGEPISVTRIEKPTDADIAMLRSRYAEALQTLYKTETGKDLIIR